ncbi:MAG: lamin tail domain-containing protein, partial [Flavobacteriales bacterium]|nr:lamin tail domain-containing protein [Flavobacteriales bacterium]
SYSSCSYLGLICNYTVSNADNFTFDDFYFGDIITDEAPPGLVSATVTGTNTLDLIFDEPVDPVSAGNNNFYFAEGLGISASAVPDGINSALVHLTFTADFEPNVLYTLMVVGVQDLEGNTMPPDVSIEFMWYVPVEATFRDVLFNEVLADPTPVVGMPDAEFIELFNASDNVYELEGWQLVNSLTPKTLPSYSLLPGAFVVLCDDDYNGQFENMIGLSSFTALTNSGDSLTLLDQNGSLIDLLVYDIAWYDTPDKADGGWSLEQINPFLPCLNSGNWQESSDSNGGTPGSVNSVFNDAPDAVDPVIVEWNIAHPDSLHLVFSETMDTTGWSLPDWSLIPFNGIVDATWNASLNEVWLAVQSPLNPPGSWQLTVTGISDCSGNTLTDITLDFVAAYTPMPGDLIINEIMADPDPALLMPAAEYLELFNKSEETIDLNGVMINDALIATQVLMLPGSYLVVGDAGDAPAFFTLTNKLLLDDFPSLTNSGATLT